MLEFVEGVKVQVAELMIGAAPRVRAPRVTVSVVLLLLQTYVAAHREFWSSVPPLILPTVADSFVEQLPPVLVLPTQIVVLLLQMVLPVNGPVAGSIGWLNVKMNRSPVSSLAALALTYWTPVATTPN